MAAANHGLEYNHHRGRRPLLRPTSRRRALLFLGITLAGFLAVNAFWRYLCTGQWVILDGQNYWANLIKPLGEMFFFPVDVLTHPWMILVNSLLLAVVFSVPIILSVLYRLAVAWVFVAVIVLLAGAPLLAIAVAGGCLLAANTRLRSDMPFLAILLGLLPVAAYLYFFGFGLADTSGVGPLQRWALNAPFLLALVAAVLAAACVLGMARVTSFRPGVVWPVLTVLLALPLTVFHLKVGADELAYGLITRNIHTPHALFEPIAAQQADDLPRLRRQAQDDLPRRQAQLMAQCSDFLAHFPTSRRAPEVLWIKAQAASIQIEQSRGELRFTSRFVLPEQAAPLWQALRERYPASPQAALAQWRLGELSLREGQFVAAKALLDESAAALRAIQDQQADEPQNASQVFTTPRGIPDRRYIANAQMTVEHLLWLIDENRVLDDAVKAGRCCEALSYWLRVNPCDPQADDQTEHYARQLAQLAEAYGDTEIGDNLALTLARLHGNAPVLLELAGGQPTDAAIEANYELGLLSLRLADAQVPPSLACQELRTPSAYFKTVMEARPNPFQALAAQRLAYLRASTPLVTQSQPATAPN